MITALQVVVVTLNANTAPVGAVAVMEKQPVAAPAVDLMEGGKVALGLQSRHTTGPGRGNRLAINLVLNVPGGKHPGDVHGRGARGGF